jgi:hypothetical protein
MKSFLLIIILLPAFVFAQSIVIKGRVINQEDQESIPQVYVGLDSVQKNITITDNRGFFHFRYKVKSGQRVIFSHMAFDNIRVDIGRNYLKKVKNDTLDLGVIKMFFGNKIFDRIEVSSDKKPETVFGSEKFSVEDFELIDNRILMLVYEKTLKRSSELVLTDQNQKVISTKFIPGQAVELIHDFRNEVYLKTTDGVYHVKVNQNDFILLTKLDQKKFSEQLEPVKDSLYEDIYFSDYSEIFPKFSYYEYDREDSVYTTVRGVIDELMMDMYRAEFKYVDVRTKIWAHNLQNETGIDKEEIVGAAVFTKSIFYEPLYAPMYVKNDTVYVFDYYKNFMYKFVSDVGVIDSIGVYYHLKPKKSGWDKNMTQDQSNNEIYGLFNKYGYSYIKPINLNTGNTDGVFKLYYRYVEKIIIKDDYVYYTYRPFESIQKKYIYREKIPNSVLEKIVPVELLSKE